MSQREPWRPMMRSVPSHPAERAGIDRRRFLLPAAGAAGAILLDACDSYGPRSATRLLRLAERGNEKIERALFRHTSMDVPASGARAAGPSFPSYFISRQVPVWDDSVRGIWRLEIGGLVDRPLKLTLPELASLPRIGYRLDHFCVEGWTAVATRTGVALRELAKVAGVQPAARYVDFESFDDNYHESWDIESAMHPQTLVVYAQDGHYLNSAWGAPARIYSPVKLGYKNTKYLTRIMFLPERTGGYWSNQGYEWYGGV
jgi:DMSO/TMAO reductase YedYZ molybdopterin-dependent catalytic subunit